MAPFPHDPYEPRRGNPEPVFSISTESWIIKTMRTTQCASIVLCYHQIGSQRTDRWDLSVSQQNFASHIELIAKSFAPIGLPHLARAQAQGNVPHKAVAITFDDGYRSILSALPILERFCVPATFFVCSSYLGKEEEFWWDQLERIFFETPLLPPTLTLAFGNVECRWQFEFGLDKLHERSTKLPSDRLRAHDAVWAKLQIASPEEQRSAMRQLLDWGCPPGLPRHEYFPISRTEFLELSKNPFVTIGGHTSTHCHLPSRSEEQQYLEIIEDKISLEESLGREVELLAYPYGAHTSATIEAAKRANFRHAFTTFPGVLSNDNNPFALPRVCVPNWTAPTLFNEMQKLFAISA